MTDLEKFIQFYSLTGAELNIQHDQNGQYVVVDGDLDAKGFGLNQEFYEALTPIRFDGDGKFLFQGLY